MKKEKAFRPDANQRTLIAIGDKGATLDEIKQKLETVMPGGGRPELVQVTIVQCSVKGWIRNDAEKGYVLTDAGKGECESMVKHHDEIQATHAKRLVAAREVKKEEARITRKADTLDKADNAERKGDTAKADKLRESARKMAP